MNKKIERRELDAALMEAVRRERHRKRPLARKKLASFSVQLFAIVAEPIVPFAITTLIHCYVAAGRAHAVVVINASGDWLVGLFDGVEAGYVRHWVSFLCKRSYHGAVCVLEQ